MMELLAFAVLAATFGSGLFVGSALTIERIQRKRLAARALPLPVHMQVWKIEGIGRVRIAYVHGGTVGFCRPQHNEDANPLRDLEWRDGTIEIDLDEFDKLATLERR